MGMLHFTSAEILAIVRYKKGTGSEYVSKILGPYHTALAWLTIVSATSVTLGVKWEQAEDNLSAVWVCVAASVLTSKANMI